MFPDILQWRKFRFFKIWNFGLELCDVITSRLSFVERWFLWMWLHKIFPNILQWRKLRFFKIWNFGLELCDVITFQKRNCAFSDYAFNYPWVAFFWFSHFFSNSGWWMFGGLLVRMCGVKLNLNRVVPFLNWFRVIPYVWLL